MERLSRMTPEETDGTKPAGGAAPPAEAPIASVAAGETTDFEEGAGDKPRVAVGEKKGHSTWRTVLETVLLLLAAVVVAVLVQSFFIKAYVIPSSSMVPTLEIGDKVMVEKVSYWFRDPRRKEMVVFRMSTANGLSPSGRGSLATTNPIYWPFEQIGETLRLTHRGTTPYVKRIVATGGETLELRKGKLYINGKLINEPYAVNDGDDYGPVKIPKGYVFCMGDNRPNSRDSRSFGPVPVASIVGRVFIRWWPPKRFGIPR